VLPEIRASQRFHVPVGADGLAYYGLYQCRATGGAEEGSMTTPTPAGDFSRRNFLKVGGGAGVVTGSYLLAGCSAFSTKAKKKDANEAATSGYQGKEAPMLASLVKQKKLPPLEQRLPANPCVLKPLTSNGIYGGTLRKGHIDPGQNDGTDLAHSNLAEWDLEAKAPVPGLAEKWEIGGNGTTYTFHLRKGLKWSDGHPFTADDLVFYYKQIYLNKTLHPAPTTWLTSGGKPMTLTKIDDTTVKIEFAAPHGLLLKYLSFPAPGLETIVPAHYMKQFHPDFVAASTLKALTKKAKFQTWDQLFNDRNDMWNNKNRPVMGAWQVTQEPRANNSTALMVRNPYYWKTDPEGRQLPYIDKIAYSFLSVETLGLRAANGEIDFDGVDMQFSNVPLLAKNARQHNYSVYRWKPDSGVLTMYVNQTHKNPVLRKLFQNKDFRIGLSVAINRKEINSALLAGQGSYMQMVAQPEDEYWKPGYGTNYLDYDVAEANKRLDAAGLTKRGSDGMRLRPDGKKLQINVLTFPLGVGVSVIDGYQYVQRHWKKVGIHMEIQNVSQDLFYKRAPNGDYDFCGYGSAAGYHWDIDPLWYVPVSSLTYWACLYGKWYETGGQQGEKPAGIYRQLQVWYDQLRATTDKQKQLDLGRKILDQHNENCWIIGIVRVPFQPVVVSNDMVNVRKDAVASFRTGIDETTLVEQLYFKNPEKH